MSLTPELVATTLRKIADPGHPGYVPMSDDDYVSAVRDVLSPAARPIWVFAYGSLLWNPVCNIVERRSAIVRGWHRAFCFRDPVVRGTPDQPGLMAALDRGGQCQGMVFRLAEPVEQNLLKLFKREMFAKKSVYVPRWLTAQTDFELVRALGFVINRDHRLYIGKLSLEEVAEVLSKAAGHKGSGAEYLYETVNQLESLGIHDRNLWRLQQLVADRLAK